MEQIMIILFKLAIIFLFISTINVFSECFILYTKPKYTKQDLDNAMVSVTIFAISIIVWIAAALATVIIM